jgi:hypothetical protein
MKLTNELRKEINAAVRANVRGAAPFAEIGTRLVNDVLGANALLWTDDSDLFDFIALRDATEINDVEQHPGCAQLDLYVTTGTRSSRELETNVAVFIRDGHVIGATSASQRVDELRASLNFPETAGW